MMEEILTGRRRLRIHRRILLDNLLVVEVEVKITVPSATGDRSYTAWRDMRPEDCTVWVEVDSCLTN
jgi:hypothetical protein